MILVFEFSNGQSQPAVAMRGVPLRGPSTRVDGYAPDVVARCRKR